MCKDRRAPVRQSRTHDRTFVRALSAGVLFCALCGAAPLSAAGAESAPALAPASPSAAAHRPNGPAATVSSAPQSAEYLTRELWSSRLKAPDPNEDAETRLALKRLIRQVRSVRFGGEASKPASSLSTPARATPEPLKVEFVVAPTAKAPAAAATAPASVEAGPSPSSRQKEMLEGLLQNPGRTSDPLEIAELLFLSGRPTEAAPFYAQALERLPPGEAATAADRAWTLFQLANCLRETNLSEAQATFAKLLSEYPDSPWTELARAQNQLVSWYQKDRPQQLVASQRP
jgi:tetratricopeptide (TPR) repeat protein